MLNAQVVAVSGAEPRTLLKTVGHPADDPGVVQLVVRSACDNEQRITVTEGASRSIRGDDT